MKQSCNVMYYVNIIEQGYRFHLLIMKYMQLKYLKTDQWQYVQYPNISNAV